MIHCPCEDQELPLYGLRAVRQLPPPTRHHPHARRALVLQRTASLRVFLERATAKNIVWHLPVRVLEALQQLSDLRALFARATRPVALLQADADELLCRCIFAHMMPLFSHLRICLVGCSSVTYFESSPFFLYNFRRFNLSGHSLLSSASLQSAWKHSQNLRLHQLKSPRRFVSASLSEKRRPAVAFFLCFATPLGPSGCTPE